MKTVLNMTITAGAVALMLGVSAPAAAQANEADGYGDGYQSGAYGRVRAADEGATIVRADGERDDSDRASVNSPIFPGDTLSTNGDQRVEVQLAGGSTVRIDRNGQLVFQSLPNPSAKYQDNSVLTLNAGVVRITSHLGEKEEFRIDTKDASIYLLEEGEYRIETDDRGGTRVASLRGVAEVVGNDASVLVRGGTRTEVIAGSTPAAARAYTAFASDGFDRWCDARDDAYRSHDRYASRDDEQSAEVPEEVRPYYGELSNNGTFANDPTYGTVWYPSGVDSTWRPYSDGYWAYGPGGYFWVSYEPWGWAPYHYGNWQWSSRGWCWIPGPVFAGAWVSWSWGSLYVGWAPLDYWGRPGWVGGPYYGGYYDPGCWSFVSYGHLQDDHIRRYAVPIGTVRDDLRHATVVSRPPQIDPRRVADPVWRDRALRQVADDHVARMRPIQADRRPEQRLSDVQNHLMRRGPQTPAVTRPSKDAGATPGFDRRVTTPRPRRILDDPLSVPRSDVRRATGNDARPETRDDVRDLYQRMSRPRETRGQDAAAPHRLDQTDRRDVPRQTPGARRPETHPMRQPADAPRTYTPRADAPRMDAPRQQAPRQQAPRQDAPRQQAPRTQAPRQDAPRQQAPRAQAPRQQAPRQDAPRQQAPRAQAPRQQAPRQQASPKERPKHGEKH